MIFSRKEIEERERRDLAPYALKSGDSRGRKHPEDEPQHRTAFQRDRDRILHTTAFRRLEYKTQVFAYYEGDHYRTRLTHTLEVGQIARSMAQYLGANEDLTYAVALAHDLDRDAPARAGLQPGTGRGRRGAGVRACAAGPPRGQRGGRGRLGP